MRKVIKQRILVWKYYFDKGFSLLNYVKYLLAFFALYEVSIMRDTKLTIFMGIIFAIVCFFLGRHFYRNDWNSIEIEIGNQINPFVKEVRKKIERFK